MAISVPQPKIEDARSGSGRSKLGDQSTVTTWARDRQKPSIVVDLGLGLELL